MVAAILPKEPRSGSRSAWDNDSRRSLANYREITMIIALLFLILFAILFPGTLRFLFVLLLIGAIMVLGGAHASGANDAADCPAFYLSGLFYRAANVCDHSWLKRPGFLITTSSAAQCKMPPKKAKSLLIPFPAD
jgi:hypothetical protein